MFYNGPVLKDAMIAVSMPMHHQPCIQGVPVTKTELIEKVSESSKNSKKDAIFRNTLPHQLFRTIEAL